jgi:peroxiredoxin
MLSLLSRHPRCCTTCVAPTLGGFAVVLCSALLLGAADDRDAQAGGANSRDLRAWYILSQTDTTGLLHGMPQWMARALPPSRREEPMWKGVDKGGCLELDLRAEGDVQGEVFVGFFKSPHWWLGEPVQMRRFPGPGQYTVERLIPGDYQLGAMVGALPEPDALGLHASWPDPVKVRADRITQVSVLVSTKFQNRPAGQPNLEKGFASQWEKMDPSRMVTVRTVDSQGKPLPFCSVTFFERAEKRIRESVGQLVQVGTDHLGYAYTDQIDGAFSLSLQRFGLFPERMASWYCYRRENKLYHTRDRPLITIKLDPFPTGSGRVVGRVHDQHGKALQTYYLTLTRTVGELRGFDDCRRYSIKLPVTDTEGRFEVGDLPAGTYTAMVRHFDYPTHVWTFRGPEFTIPDKPNAVVQFDVEVEANECLYGRATYADGSPVYPGTWIAWFERDPSSPWGGESFAMGTEPDGSFRVCLSREQRRKLIANSQGMVELYADGSPRTRVQVHVDRLSKDKRRPYQVVLPPQQPQQPEHGDSDRAKAAAPAQATPGHKIAYTLGAFELVATDGRTHRLSDYRGKPVLLNVFTTWCGPCQEERPHLVEFHESHAKEGLVILAICRGEQPAAAERFASRCHLPFPVLIDQSRSAFDYDQFTDDKGQSGVPTSILLDRDHRVVYAQVGFSDEKLERLRKAIEDVLGIESGSSHRP